MFPIAVTREELTTLLDLYETFAAVDPTGLDANPFLEAATRDMHQTFAVPEYRPDEQLHDDVAALLSDFSDDLGGDSIGVVDATPTHTGRCTSSCSAVAATTTRPTFGSMPTRPQSRRCTTSTSG